MRLGELKRVAEAATPGRWKVDVLHLRQPYDHNQDGTEADNTFASTFNPDVVLKLLAVVKAARAHYPVAIGHMAHCSYAANSGRNDCDCGEYESRAALGRALAALDK